MPRETKDAATEGYGTYAVQRQARSHHGSGYANGV